MSRDDVERARSAIESAVADGRIDPDVGRERLERVLHTVTQRDLWKASGGLAGSPQASAAARAETYKALRLVAAIVVFAALVMAFLTWALLYYEP